MGRDLQLFVYVQKRRDDGQGWYEVKIPLIDYIRQNPPDLDTNADYRISALGISKYGNPQARWAWPEGVEITIDGLSPDEWVHQQHDIGKV